jgi:hypothetical protein
MDLKKELDVLKSYYESKDTVNFEKQTDFIYENFTSESDMQKVHEFTSDLLSALVKKTDAIIEIATARIQLEEKLCILPLSYIAEKYFSKSRQWLYQKINGNMKNGKPASFSPAEKAMFNRAIKEISNDIGSLELV